MNISYEHNERMTSTSDANNNGNGILVKQEPNLAAAPNSGRPAERALKNSSMLHKKSTKNDSDFEPAEASEEDDFSIPESETASWDSGPRSGKRGARAAKSVQRRSAGHQRKAAHYANLKRQAESDDEEYFADMPRQRLSRRCKTAATKKSFLEFDEIPSSSSPEEFDERIHVRTKAEKLRLEMEAAAAGKSMAEESSAAMQVKAEPQEMQAAVKAEPIDAKLDEQQNETAEKKEEQNLDISMNTEGSGEHMQEEEKEQLS